MSRRDHLRNLKIISNWIPKYACRSADLIELVEGRIRRQVGCEGGNKSSGFVSGAKFPDELCLSEYQGGVGSIGDEKRIRNFS